MSERFCARTVGARGLGPTPRAQNRTVAALAGVLILGIGSPAYGQDDDVLSTITDDRIAESSALVQSTVDPDLAYTINDSGNDTAVYVLELATGDVVGTTILDVGAEDTEAMAIGADGRLYLADIGDNDANRRRVALYAIDQPEPGDSTVTPETYEVRYRDGPSDAETLLVDPVTGRMSIVTKNLLAGAVYRLPDPLQTDRVNVARPIRDVALPGVVTDGAYLPDGRGVLLRTYIDVAVYTIPGWRELDPIDTPHQPQSESLAAWDTGRSMLVGTEKLPSTIIEVRIPDREWDQLHAGPDRGVDSIGSAESTAAPASEDDGISRRWVVASGAAIVVLGAAWLWAARRPGQGRRRSS